MKQERLLNSSSTTFASISNISGVGFNREERWYPTLGKIKIVYDLSSARPEEFLLGPKAWLKHFHFTALYRNKLGQKRTKSFIVKIEWIDRKHAPQEYWINTIEAKDGWDHNHMDHLFPHVNA